MTARTQRDDSVTDLDAVRQDRRQAAESAAAWSQWSADISERLASVEGRVKGWFGDGGKIDDDDANVPGMVEVVARLQDEIEKRTCVEAIAALREETQIELAVTRDELSSRIDRVLYGSGLDVDAEELRRTMFELRSDATKRFDTISALLDKLAERIDAVDKRRRYDRNTARTEGEDLAKKLGALVAAMSTATDVKLNKIAADIASLEARTAEAFEDKR